MGKSQETFGKKEKEKKRLKKRKEKAEKREERKANSQKGAPLEDMLMYVDENGQLTDSPPDPLKKKKINAKNIEISVPKKEIDPDAGGPKKGKVEFYNDQKGYGFIKDLDTQEKFFVHINGCNDDIVEGDKVTFELERGLKGMNAVNVTVVN
jgi:cold shock CspA family protein